MRILVLGHARSGSTSLLNYIAESKGYKAINEPSNPIHPGDFTEEEIWDEDNVVVKELYHHGGGLRDNKKYEKLKASFDKIVSIYRENTLDTYESTVYALSSNNWQSKYTLNESEVKEREGSSVDKRNFLAYRKQQISALKSENFFSVTYEGLYYKGTDKKRLDDYLEITDSKGDDILDNKHRLRQST
tara:strand:- start:58 stop:621 length:564 start_codon:yes stop_codon:yes gene_type:complete